MNKSLSYVNLNLELHVVSTFWLGSDTSGTFSLHFAQPSYELERPALKTGRCSYVGAELTFVAANFLQKSPVCYTIHFYFHLFVNWTISVFVSSRLAQNHLQTEYSILGKQCVFWSHPQCFGSLGKFQHNIKISIKTARVSRLSVSCDYDLSKQRYTCSVTSCKYLNKFLS